MPGRRLAIDNGEPRKLSPMARRSSAGIDLSRRAELTLVLRSRGSEEEWRTLVAELTSGLPGNRRYLTRAELARKWGASPEDIEAVRKFAIKHRLKVVSADGPRRCIVVSGSLQQLGRAFDVEFHAVDHPLGTFHSHRKAPRVPKTIHAIVECILGLENLPVAETHALSAAKGSGMDRRALLEAYAIPRHLRGKGQCVAVIELGGGFHKRDWIAYFKQLGLAPPRLHRRGIGGVKNKPAPPSMIRKFVEALPTTRFKPGEPHTVTGNPREDAWVMWTIETTMDLDLVGTIAPETSILLVQTSNDLQGQYHAVTSVITDAKNAPSVLSCSWGGLEPGQAPLFMRALDRWFQSAAVLGMTVCCSSGDAGDGTANHQSPGTFTIQFPASSPHVLACGGTTLHPKAGTEVAWKQMQCGRPIASGGGFSDFFPLPSWQRAAGINARDWIPRGAGSGKGRAIPDIAAKANMEQGYSIVVGGVEYPAGGTSAAAPLWAGAAAILNEGLNVRIGSLNALLYDGSLRSGLRDIVAGNTGVFRAGKGWDACTGWGSPRVEALLRILRGD